MLKKHLALIAIITCLSSTLCGCGFTLRTQNSLPPQLRSIYFQSDTPYEQLGIALKKELRATGITLQDDVSKAPFVLHMTAPNFGHTTDTSNGPSTQARIYHLTLATSFSITDKSGKVVLAPQTVSAMQDLTLNANEIFDTSTQVDVAKENMRRILVTKIFDRLSSQKTFTALK